MDDTHTPTEVIPVRVSSLASSPQLPVLPTARLPMSNVTMLVPGINSAVTGKVPEEVVIVPPYTVVIPKGKGDSPPGFCGATISK